MMLGQMAGRGCDWLVTPGPHSDVVISTRIRLARNVEGFPFPGRCDAQQRRELERSLREWIVGPSNCDDLSYWNLDELPALDRQLLMERHLISQELMKGDGDRGVAFSNRENLSVMTNEEDHIRIQVLRPGLALDVAFEEAMALDRKLEERVPYAFDQDYGFLTSCPTNTGTGLRVSLMMHLPALVISDLMDRVFRAASKVGLTVRGFYGEGSKASGDVIQLSNQDTLGRTEDEIVQTMAHIAPKIVEYERTVRQHLLGERRLSLEDKVWRSLGMLRYARKLSSAETMELLSAVRLGVTLQMLPTIGLADVNELFVITQPAHLQTLKGRELSEEDRDAARATLLQHRFRPESN